MAAPPVEYRAPRPSSGSLPSTRALSRDESIDTQVSRPAVLGWVALGLVGWAGLVGAVWLLVALVT